MIDILLINPSSITEQNNPIPFGVAYLASFLEENKFKVKILDLSVIEKNDEEILEYIEKIRPKRIGISCMSVHVDFTKRITKKIKKDFKDIEIIVGGIHPTALPNESLDELEDVDIVVLGEGEKTLLELMQGKRLEKIKGIGYKKNHKIKITPSREFIMNLDDLPFPARHLLEGINKYRLGLDWEGKKPAVTLFSSRGCSFNCIYCASKVMWKRRVRFISAKRVLEEIDYLVKKYKIKEILFYDDHFVLDKKRLSEICNGLIERNYNLSWCCLSRVDGMNLKTARLMKKAGCHMISFGVESGSQTILNALSKNTKVEKIIQAFNACTKAGINTKASFIFGGPKETKKTIKETQNLLKIILPDYIWLFIMTPMPGTELYRLHKEAGIASNEWSRYDQTTYNKFYDTNLNYEDLRKAVSETYKGYYFSREYFFSQIKKFSLRKIKVSLEILKRFSSALRYMKMGRKRNE